MKNKFILTAVLCLAFSVSFAQIGGFLQDTRFGVKAGLNYSRVKDIHSESGSRLGFNAGVQALIPVSYGNEFFIQPEITYSQKGESNEISGEGKEVYRMDYIDVPVLFKAYFSERDTDFFALFGPKFSFLIDDSIKNPLEKGERYHSDEYNKFDFGLVGGVGFSYLRNWEVDARIEYGFMDTNKTQKDSNNNVVTSLSLSYIF
ncbi:PorT family protein [Ornithobacterium rhinotracheale]|uniref:PorT family protein n=1 Tax=Ornithobacterium rhinotracheale TaxID=28251 RepID=A0A3R5Y4N1_ORNRH|nr:porin family protein [Ornithobacterium rhinotracheale]QAR31626.1 PorT family protein [Ornithobacterium rhinotracheale]